jgi:hypothetical protein
MGKRPPELFQLSDKTQTEHLQKSDRISCFARFGADEKNVFTVRTRSRGINFNCKVIHFINPLTTLIKPLMSSQGLGWPCVIERTKSFIYKQLIMTLRPQNYFSSRSTFTQRQGRGLKLFSELFYFFGLLFTLQPYPHVLAEVTFYSKGKGEGTCC